MTFKGYLESYHTTDSLMQRFEARLKSDSNFMGNEIDALVELISPLDYTTPGEWIEAVRKFDPGLVNMFHFKKAIDGAKWDLAGRPK